MNFNQKTDAAIGFAIERWQKKEFTPKEFRKYIYERMEEIRYEARQKFSFVTARWEIEDDESRPFIRYWYVISSPIEKNPKQQKRG